jgi:hypothetical protein
MLDSKRSERSLSSGERTIVRLLLDGNTEFLAVLRSQLSPPFHLRIERRTPKTKPAIYRTPPNEYHIDFVYDDRLRGDYSAGSSVSLKIDDLVVVDQRLPDCVVVEGHVNRGVLANIVFRSQEPVRWPKHLRADEWWYVRADGVRSEHRVDLSELDATCGRPKIEDLPDGWVRDFLLAAFDGGSAVVICEGAREHEISDLEARLSVAIPPDFADFLRATDGATLWEANVFGCDEVFKLDEREFGGAKVVFSQTIDGSFCAFDLNRYAGSLEYPVLFFDHESQEVSVVSRSFREWLSYVPPGCHPKAARCQPPCR